MATVLDTKIAKPFFPSLLHLSAVQVAYQLYDDFSFASLEEAFERIERGTGMTFFGFRKFYGFNFLSLEAALEVIERGTLTALFGFRKFSMWVETRRAQERLLFIPSHLRRKVMEAVHGCYYGIVEWKHDHSSIDALPIDPNYCWKSDGTIDRVKTAQQLALNVDIDIRKRFELACMYCLEDIIKTLWNEIEESGGIESFGTVNNPAVRFWIKWIRRGSRVPWRRAAAKYVASSPHYFKDFRCCSLFSSLPPKLRKRVLKSLCYAPDDHFRLCLFATTKEEEQIILQLSSPKFLSIFTKWPQRSLFLEIAKKVVKSMEETSFTIFLEFLFLLEILWKNFDFYEHFVGFWNMSPILLRETAKQSSDVKNGIASCFREIRCREVDKNKRRYSKLNS